MRARFLVAMSGGVDSSVAAARLVAAGHDVIGVTLHLWDYPDDRSVRGRCCAPEDVHDARRVADRLGIPHYAFDRRELFAKEVVDYFVDAYLGGATPSPCVRCNRGVKIRELVHLADRLGAEVVATGHYARTRRVGASHRLCRAADRSKDQSYFLHMLASQTLARLHFPLGESTKSEVREQALALELPGAQKGESQELCFVPTGRYDAFVASRAPERLRPGPVVDDRGHVVGAHPGIHAFTLGQRRNLGVSVGRRLYVSELDPATATVTLGTKESLAATGARVREPSLAPETELPLRCEVAVRYQGATAVATVRRDGGDAIVDFDEPVRAVVPGQYAVFYRGDDVLGGGVIASARRQRPVGPERGMATAARGG